MYANGSSQGNQTTEGRATALINITKTDGAIESFIFNHFSPGLWLRCSAPVAANQGGARASAAGNQTRIFIETASQGDERGPGSGASTGAAMADLAGGKGAAVVAAAADLANSRDDGSPERMGPLLPFPSLRRKTLEGRVRGRRRRSGRAKGRAPSPS